MITETQLQVVLLIALIVEGILEYAKTRLPASLSAAQRTGLIRLGGSVSGVVLVALTDLSIGLFVPTLVEVSQPGLQVLARVILWLAFGVAASYGSHGVHIVRDAFEAGLGRLRSNQVAQG